MEWTSPIDDPNRVAFVGSTTWAPRREDRMESVVLGLAQMISDFSMFSITDFNYCFIPKSLLYKLLVLCSYGGVA